MTEKWFKHEIPTPYGTVEVLSGSGILSDDFKKRILQESKDDAECGRPECEARNKHWHLHTI